ncbi:MAG: ferredoxin--nitrite reductase [Sulfurovum sp.]
MIAVLQKAFDARNKKLNKIEVVKNMKNPQEALEKLEYYALHGYDSIPDEDKKYFLKCFGIYDRPTTPERFMLKLRIPAGHLTSNQANEIGECARDFGEDYIDLTTRSQCELRYLKIENLPTIISRLKAVGIDAYQTGVDNIRGIMGDPLDDLAFDNILPSQKTIIKLQEKFLYSPDWISTLPRKFNTAITGSMSNRCNAYCHDASFVLAQKNGVYGYNMYLGGKVGIVGKSADIFLKNEDEVIKAFDAIIELFKRFGFRDNRNKNRLHFLIEAVGIEVMSSAIREYSKIDFATSGESMTKIDFNDSEQGKIALKDGSFGVHIVIPSGMFSGSDLVEVARLGTQYGNEEIRFDMEQNIYILGVRDVDTLLSEEFFGRYKNIDTPYFNHLIACAGTKHCPFGVIENKNDAINMSNYLNKAVPLDSGRVRMYWSGCVKGCGIHGLADIGFEGCKAKVDGNREDGVNISLGGKLVSDVKEGHTIIKSAPLRFAHLYIETLMVEYKKYRKVDESFESFNDRVLRNYSYARVGFAMILGAYLREKNIDIGFGFSDTTNTGGTEAFEIFELGRKLYYNLTKKSPYSSYTNYTNTLKNEKLEDIRKLVPNIDKNLALMIERMIGGDEDKRAVVFSELKGFLELG